MKFLLFSILIIAIYSCERRIDFTPDTQEPKLVVEGIIENEQPPLVYLSKSVGYFSKLDLATLSNSFVHGAEVYMSNGSVTHKLKEYNIPVGNGYSIYYYSIDSTSLATAFLGQLNTGYSLRIVSEGKEYTATTRIPLITKRIDSLYWKQAGGSNPPEKVALMLRATDPPGLGDNVRYYTRQNSNPFFPGMNSVYDDQVIDNSTYDIQVEKGIDRNAELPEGYAFFDKGDTVTLKLANIDKATYDFWRTMEFTYISVGNPFSSPTKVLGNISNGALGYFGGYAAQFRTIVIPR